MLGEDLAVELFGLIGAAGLVMFERGGKKLGQVHRPSAPRRMTGSKWQRRGAGTHRAGCPLVI